MNLHFVNSIYRGIVEAYIKTFFCVFSEYKKRVTNVTLLQMGVKIL